MVGVARSTGCLSCRKSKVKCDEVNPLCGRCKKTGRVCEYADRFKFVHETSKHMANDRSGDEAPWPLIAPSERGIFLYTTERQTKSGGLFQKWHRSVLHSAPTASPPLSSADIRAFNFMKCWDEGPLGMRFDLVAGWFKGIPPRLGKSSALDDAVHLVSIIHGRMLSGLELSQWVCPATYIKALRSLRNALLDPKEGYWVETMAAAMILYHIEEKFGCPYDWNTIRHAGGIGRLLERRGPVKLKDDFEWQIIGQIQGPIISRGVLLGQPCFLSEPKWAEYFDSFEPGTESGAIVQELSLQVAHWPGLTGKLRRLHSGLLSILEMQDTQMLISKLRSRLDALGIVIDECIARNDDIMLVPSTHADSPFYEVYEFRSSV